MPKLGPHIQRSTFGALAWATVAPCVKAVMNLEPLRVAQPGAIKVARYWQPNADWVREDPVAMGLKVAAWLSSEGVGPLTPNLYVQSTNEIHQSIGNGLLSLLLWHKPFAAVLHERGYEVAGLGLGVDNPPGTEAEVRQALELMAEFNFGDSDAWLMNEYWADGSVKYGPENERTALRHRWYHELLSGQHPAIIVGETSSDKVEGIGTSGWRLRCSPDEIRAEAARYAALLEADPYVLASFWFGMGPENDWLNFASDDLGFENTYRGLPTHLTWTPDGANPPEVLPAMTIEQIAGKPQRDDPSRNYGIWTGPGIKGTKGAIRGAWADTPDWQVLFEIGNEAVVIDSHGVYRPS